MLLLTTWQSRSQPRSAQTNARRTGPRRLEANLCKAFLLKLEAPQLPTLRPILNFTESTEPLGDMLVSRQPCPCSRLETSTLKTRTSRPVVAT